MSKREIWFGGHRYEPCDIVYDEVDNGTIVGKYMVARRDDGSEHIVHQAYGTWMAMSVMDLISALKGRDRLVQQLAVQHRVVDAAQKWRETARGSKNQCALIYAVDALHTAKGDGQ